MDHCVNNQLCDSTGKCYTIDDINVMRHNLTLNTISYVVFGFAAFVILVLVCIKAWECLYYSFFFSHNGQSECLPLLSGVATLDPVPPAHSAQPVSVHNTVHILHHPPSASHTVQ